MGGTQIRGEQILDSSITSVDLQDGSIIQSKIDTLRPVSNNNNTIKIKAGILKKKDGTGAIKFSETNTSAFDPVIISGNTRYDLVGIDTTGTLSIIKGTEGNPGSVPPYPQDKFIVAEVKIDETSNVIISDSDITDVRASFEIDNPNFIIQGDTYININDTGDGYISLVEDGTEVVRINNGNVGIGTTSPNQKLDVAGSMNLGGHLIMPIGGYNIKLIGNNSGLTIIGGNASHTGSNIGLYGYQHASNPNIITFNRGNGSISIEEARFDANGNLGIGTASPGAKLDVNGSGSFSGQIYSSGTAGNYFAGNVGIGTTNPAYKLDVVGDSRISGQAIITGTATVQGNAFSVGGSNFVVNAGNVGIGTTNPAYKLDVVDSVRIGSGVSGIYLTNGRIWSENNAIQLVGNNAPVWLGNSVNSPILSIVSNNVGIGTTTPSEKLVVVGNIKLSGNLLLGDGTSGDKILIANNADTNKPAFKYNDTTKKWQYSNDGSTWNDIGSGSGGTPGGSNGQIQYNNNGVFGGASALYYDSVNNRLGLGLSNPTHKFHLTSSGDNKDILFIQETTGGAGNTANIAFKTNPGTGDTDAVMGRIKVIDQGSFNADMAFEVKGNSTNDQTTTEVMRITNVGRVGIKTASPSYDLHVAGSGYFSSLSANSLGATNLNLTNLSSTWFYLSNNTLTLRPTNQFVNNYLVLAAESSSATAVLKLTQSAFTRGNDAYISLDSVLTIKTSHWGDVGAPPAMSFNLDTTSFIYLRNDLYRVGIFNTSPVEALDVIGNIKTDSSVIINPTPNNTTASGTLINATAGENLSAGDICYLKSDGKYWKANATSSSTMPACVMATQAISANTTGKFLIQGYWKNTSLSLTIGGLIYMSTTSGGITQTAPNATGNQIQVLGYATASDTIYFNPNLMLLEVA